MKNGQTPQAGPPNQGTDEDAELTRELLNLDVNKPQPTPRSTSNVPTPNQPPQNQNFGNQPTMGQNSGWQQPSQQQQFHPSYGQQFGGHGFPPQPQFQPVQPPQQQHHHNPTPQHYAPPPAQTGSGKLNCFFKRYIFPILVTLDDFIEARKLTKMATSALDYEDAKTAIDFLRKALNVLEKN